MGRGGGGATMPGNQLPPAARSHKVTLVRPHSGAGFGFSIRGGVEHSCGIYVSEVEVGGEAHLAGLQPGDQITRISGVPPGAGLLDMQGNCRLQMQNTISRYFPCLRRARS